MTRCGRSWPSSTKRRRARHWPNDDPVGKTLRFYPRDTSPSIRIVGVVGDVRSMGARVAAPPAIYVPYDQAPRPAYQGRSMTFVVRARRPPDRSGRVRRALWSQRSMRVCRSRPSAPDRRLFRTASGQTRFTTLAMSFFAGVAFFLAALGLYGVVAYAVEQRVREMGIRIALGARRGEIFRLIVGNAMGLDGRCRRPRRRRRPRAHADDGRAVVCRTQHGSGDVCRGDRTADDRRPARELHPRAPRDAGRPVARAAC